MDKSSPSNFPDTPLETVEPMSYSRCSLFLLISVLAVGCGGVPEAKVSGTVVYKNAPVSKGEVNLVMKEKGIAAIALLDEAGKFNVDGTLTPGIYTIHFSVPHADPMPPGTKKTAIVTKVDLPKKYLDAKTTTLTQEIKGGENVLTITVPES